jgi:hypothetical protein
MDITVRHHSDELKHAAAYKTYQAAIQPVQTLTMVL